MPFFSSKFCTLLLLVLLSGSAATTAWAEDEPKPAEKAPENSYVTAIEGAPKDMDKTLLELTEAEKQKNNPPPTLYLLQRRLEGDVETLRKAMRAKGYYDVKAKARLQIAEQPYRALFEITPGEPYILKSARVVEDARSDTKEVILPNPDVLELGIGGAVDYEVVEKARDAVRSRVYEANCLRRVRVRPHLRVDTNTKTAEAIYRVWAGKEAQFGALAVDGLQTVEQPYVDRKIPWKKGECYKPAKLESLQLSLLQSNLFSTTDIKMADEPDEDGTYPVTLTLKERAQRSIKAGIGYATEDGFDFKPSWEHRNFFGQGEKVVFEGTISTFLQSLKGRLERPDFWRKSQTLVLESEIAQAETDAYDSTSFSASAQLSRPLAKNLTGALGVAYALKTVDDDGLNSGEETFSLVSFPGYLEHNTRDDALNPTKGHVLRVDLEPFIETLEQNTFLKSQGTAKFYYQHANLPLQPIWAFRGTLGSIIGSGRGSLPADERFYSGGGGSVRGYAFQQLGPLNGGTPDGGRSLVEFSGELRLRVTDSIGLVPFVDAGNVYADPYPEFNGDLFYAAGLGFRYFTSFGPFRLDIAAPLDKRDGVDDDYQFYISFGQAF